MKLILLAGNSISNKEWIENVEKTLRPLFTETELHYYQHWTTGDGLIDLDRELDLLSKDINDSEKYVIFAKSAGTLLALKGVRENKLSPHKCIFVGTAINWGREKNFSVDEWLLEYSIPTLFIQKTKDPTSTFEELSSLLNECEVKSFTLKEIPGEDHHYDEIESLKMEIKDFL